MTAPEIPSNLQHYAVAILLFDQEYAKVVRHQLPLDCFSGDGNFTKFMGAVYAFVDKHEAPPGEMTPLLIESLPGIDEDGKDNLNRIYTFCSLTYAGQNTKYVLERIETFHRYSILKDTIIKASTLIEQPHNVEEIEALLQEGLKTQAASFNKGTTLEDAVQRNLARDSESGLTLDDRIITGIRPFDDYGIVPRRKRMYLFIALPKQGKSWWLVDMGKQSLLEGKKVLHISLEMPEEEVQDRYLQALGSFVTDPFYKPREKQPCIGADSFSFYDNTRTVPLLTNPKDIAHFQDLFINDSHTWLRDNLIIKEFPEKTLTVGQLEAYIEGLRIHQKFVPDTLCLDYPDLMNERESGASKDYRIAMGDVYRKVRGMCKKRNIILCTASQVNRSAAISTCRRIEQHHIAEDWSKIATADVIVSYHRQPHEEAMNLGRLYVIASRYSRSNVEVLVTQNYARGQFALQSVEYTSNWETRIKEIKEKIDAA